MYMRLDYKMYSPKQQIHFVAAVICDGEVVGRWDVSLKLRDRFEFL